MVESRDQDLFDGHASDARVTPVQELRTQQGECRNRLRDTPLLSPFDDDIKAFFDRLEASSIIHDHRAPDIKAATPTYDLKAFSGSFEGSTTYPDIASNPEDEDALEWYLEMYFEPSIEDLEPRGHLAVETGTDSTVFEESPVSTKLSNVLEAFVEQPEHGDDADLLEHLQTPTLPNNSELRSSPSLESAETSRPSVIKSTTVVHKILQPLSEQKMDVVAPLENITSLRKPYLHKHPQSPAIPNASEPEPPPGDPELHLECIVQSASPRHHALDPMSADSIIHHAFDIEFVVSDRRIPPLPSGTSEAFVESSEALPTSATAPLEDPAINEAVATVSKDCPLDVLIHSIEDLISCLEPAPDLEGDEDSRDEFPAAFPELQPCLFGDRNISPEADVCLVESPKLFNDLPSLRDVPTSLKSFNSADLYPVQRLDSSRNSSEFSTVLDLPRHRSHSPAYLEKGNNSMEDIADPVESLRPSQSLSTPPLVQRSQQHPECFAPSPFISESLSSIPAAFSNLFSLDFAMRDRTRRDLSAPSLGFPLCIDSIASPPSSSQPCVSSSLHTSCSPSPIPFPSGRSPPFVSTPDLVPIMPLSTSPSQFPVPGRFPYSVSLPSSSSSTSIVSILARVFIFVLVSVFGLFLSYPPYLFPQSFPLVFPPRSVSSPTNSEVKIPILFHRQVEGQGRIVANGPGGSAFVRRSTSSTPCRPRKPGVLLEEVGDILEVQIDRNEATLVTIGSPSLRYDSAAFPSAWRPLSTLSKPSSRVLDPTPPATFAHLSSSPSISGATSAVHAPRRSEIIVLGASPIPRRLREPGDLFDRSSSSLEFVTLDFRVYQQAVPNSHEVLEVPNGREVLEVLDVCKVREVREVCEAPEHPEVLEALDPREALRVLEVLGFLEGHGVPGVPGTSGVSVVCDNLEAPKAREPFEIREVLDVAAAVEDLQHSGTATRPSRSTSRRPREPGGLPNTGLDILGTWTISPWFPLPLCLVPIRVCREQGTRLPCASSEPSTRLNEVRTIRNTIPHLPVPPLIVTPFREPSPPHSPAFNASQVEVLHILLRLLKDFDAVVSFSPHALGFAQKFLQTISPYLDEFGNHSDECLDAQEDQPHLQKPFLFVIGSPLPPSILEHCKHRESLSPRAQIPNKSDAFGSLPSSPLFPPPSSRLSSASSFPSTSQAMLSVLGSRASSTRLSATRVRS